MTHFAEVMREALAFRPYRNTSSQPHVTLATLSRPSAEYSLFVFAELHV